MRAVVLVPILLALAAPVAMAQTPLGADIENGVVVWQGSMVLYRRYDGTVTENRFLRVTVANDDILSLLARYPDVDIFYVVVRLSVVDDLAGNPPAVKVLFVASGVPSWSSPWVFGPEAVLTVYRQYLEQLVYAQTPTVTVELYPYTLPYNNDSSYAVKIEFVAIAPPEHRNSDNSDGANTTTVVKEMVYPVAGDRTQVLLVGAGALVLGIIVGYAVVRGRR